MSIEGDKLRELAGWYEALQAYRDQLERENADLKAQLAALQPKPLLWRDDFSKPVADVSDGGSYLLDAPAGSLKTLPEDGGFLSVQCRAMQDLDINGTRRRSELGLPEPGQSNRIFKRDPYGSVRWYALSIRFSDTSYKDPHKVVVMQWHGAAGDPGDPTQRNPVLSLEHYSKSGHIQFVQVTEDGRKTLWGNTKAIDPLKWYRVIVRAKWMGANSVPPGELVVWVDGVQVIVQIGKNAYDDAATPWVFFRYGLYWPSATDSMAQPTIPLDAMHEVHFRDLRLGDERHTLADFTTPNPEVL